MSFCYTCSFRKTSASGSELLQNCNIQILRPGGKLPQPPGLSLWQPSQPTNLASLPHNVYLKAGSHSQTTPLLHEVSHVLQSHTEKHTDGDSFSHSVSDFCSSGRYNLKNIKPLTEASKFSPIVPQPLHSSDVGSTLHNETCHLWPTDNAEVPMDTQV